MRVMPLDLGANPLSFHEAWSGLWKKPLKERQAQLSSLLETLWGPTINKDKPHIAEKQVKAVNCAEENDENVKREDLNHDNIHKNTTTRKKKVKSKHRLTLPKLEDQFANMMIENCIGTMSLPVGLGLNITINGQPLIVPMCVEESSVVAAASSAAKTISLNGGFCCSSSSENVIISQIQLCFNDKSSALGAIELFNSMKPTIIDKANEFCPSMLKRGGGVVDVVFYNISADPSYISKFYSPFESSSFPIWVIANIKINVCESMGANCANTVAEGLSSFLSDLVHAPLGFRVVSNFSRDKYSTASFCIPVSALNYKNFTGLDLAKKIVEANIWAACDIHRATTHNKGIMNGIDAVALATGQDWRAIEAAVHSYATVRDPLSSYAPLTDYWIDSSDVNCPFSLSSVNSAPSELPDNDTPPLFLHGSLSLSIPTGIRGGAISMNSAYSSCLKIMGPDITSKKLAEIMVATGLAQNFAALRALSTVGIQSGHMSLHAQNIAVHAGVPVHLIPSCNDFMLKSGKISSEGVSEFLASLNTNSPAS